MRADGAGRAGPQVGGARQSGDERTVESDEVLLTRVQAGERRALEALYQRHAAWLAARLHARTGSRDLAEEALQDTFVAVWRKAGSYRGDGEVGAWLWGIAQRRLISLARKRRLPTVTLDAVAEHADRAPGPEDTAMSGEEAAQVRRAVESLPADQREAILAVVYQGQSVQQAALAASVAEGTVKSRLYRARQRIMKELRP